MNILKQVDKFLNWITMYKLTLYILILYVSVAIIGSLLGFLPFDPFIILVNSLLAVLFCYLSNYIFSKIFKAVTSTESFFITALIIILIIPINLPGSFKVTLAASILAMASKYLLAIKKRHIFNPAAIAVVVIGFFSSESEAIWWVGNSFMLPFVIAGGFLIVRKTRREVIAYSFIVTYLLIIGTLAFIKNPEVSSVFLALKEGIFQSSLIFFATIMLIEPLTSPTSEKKQISFAILIAILYAAPQLSTSFLIMPETALCIGNIIAFFIYPNYRLSLTLKVKNRLSKDTFIFIFNSVKGFKYSSGQYLEWTLPHKNSDSRGNRRYFSLASSPTENTPMIVVKYYEPPSSFKRTLFSLPMGEKIIASQLSGDFVLPKNLSKHLVFIAGGVGIAPFRSMIRYIIDKNLKVNITLLFSNKTKDDVLLKDLLKDASKYGINTVNILTDKKSVPKDWNGESGQITLEMIKRLIPDFVSASFYVSGPQPMVQSIKDILLKLGVVRKNIKVDFFPGYTS